MLRFAGVLNANFFKNMLNASVKHSNKDCHSVQMLSNKLILVVPLQNVFKCVNCLQIKYLC